MDVPIVIEPVAGNRHRATGAGGVAVGLIAEAVDRLAEMIRSRLNAVARLVELSLGASAAPWKEDAGCLRDSSLYELWREAMEEYGRQLDEDPEAL